MRRIFFFVAFLSFLLFSQYSRGQSVCFSAGVALVQTPGNPCAMVAQDPTGNVGVDGALSFGLIGNFHNLTYSGQLTGDLGQIVNDGTAVTSQGCLTYGNLHVNTIYSPGVHIVSAQYVLCGQYGPQYYFGQVIIVVLPPNPTTNPPPPCSTVLIDPIKSNLVRGGTITANTALLGIPSNFTDIGVSADGVTQVVVGIPTQNVGDEVQLNLINDAGSPSSSNSQDGGLTVIGGDLNSLSNNIPLTSVDTSQGPMAFGIYQGPTNFARGTQDFPQDNTAISRQVTLQTICLTSGGSPSSPSNNPVTIMRPPVVLVHGLWADASAWDGFAPTSGSSESTLWNSFVKDKSRFAINYGQPVAVTSTTPAYNPQITSVMGSALGFAYNAQNTVLPAILDDISAFASDFDIAAVQADVIAHSMGGNISRYMPLLDQGTQSPVFLTPNTYGHGPIEKLITIGTPHLGSPLAIDFLPLGSTDVNACVRNELATNQLVSLQTATMSGVNWPGGVGDLSGNGQNTDGASAALVAIQNAQGAQPFPMAYISAATNSATNLADLSCSNPLCTSNMLRLRCYLLPGTSDPLAGDLTQSNWNNVFNNQPNDGVVPLTSELNGPNAPSGTIPTNTGDIHSQGLLKLNFLGPYELEDSVIGIEAVDLLNEAKSGTDYQQ